MYLHKSKNYKSMKTIMISLVMTIDEKYIHRFCVQSKMDEKTLIWMSFTHHLRDIYIKCSQSLGQVVIVLPQMHRAKRIEHATCKNKA